MKKKNVDLRRHRQKRERRVILSLLTLLLSLTFLFIYIEFDVPPHQVVLSLFKQREEATSMAKYQKNQLIVLSQAVDASVDLHQVGYVSAVLPPRHLFDKEVRYTLTFPNGKEIVGVDETILIPIVAQLEIGQEVELVDDDSMGIGRVEEILVPNRSNTADLRYKVNFPDQSTTIEASLLELSPIFKLPLQAANSGRENHQIIQTYLEKSKAFPYAVLDFPEGEFAIGSEKEEDNYLVLTSNVWFRGNSTTLLVDGSARWFGFATGPAAHDGVSNFTMTGLAIRAKDLTRGARFIIMPNHGSNWYISGNSFTLVHALGSHVFDLGGLQDSVFSYNQFIGYAPELVEVSSIEGRQAHDFYAEAIQLDVSDASVPWDGGMMGPLDPHYAQNSQNRLMSSNITIAYNEFLPYYDGDGQLKAYSASLGQHSSEVGYVAIYGNFFKDSLVKRYPVDGELAWYFDPILIRSFEHVDIYANEFVN